MINYNFNTHFQARVWEQGRSPVGSDCYHPIYLNCKTDFFLMFIIGAMTNSTLRNYFQTLKHYNLTYLSHKIFFNVKILKKSPRY